MTNAREDARLDCPMPQGQSGILDRLPELGTAEPDVALSIYTEISDALVDALEGSDGSLRPT